MPAFSRDFSRRNFGRGFSRDAKSGDLLLKSAATSVLSSQRRYFLTNDAVVPRQCRPRGSSTDSRRTTVNGLFASRLTVTSCLTVARFDRTMPAFVIPRRGSRGRQCLVSVSSSDATHPGEMTDPGEAWPLPKRLRVRLQTSAERFGKDTDLDERLRLAERLQVRSSTAERASRAFRGFVFSPCERRFTVRVRARGRLPETRSARAHHDCMAELEAIRRRNASLCFARRGYPPTHAASEPRRTFRDTHASLFSPRGTKSTKPIGERFVDFRLCHKRVPRFVPDPEALPPLPPLPTHKRRSTASQTQTHH